MQHRYRGAGSGTNAAYYSGKCCVADSNRTGNSNNPADRYSHHYTDNCADSHHSPNADT